MNIIEQLSICIEKGKINKNISYPPELAGQDGADELTQTALKMNIAPNDILYKACIPAMKNIGEKFKNNEVFVPQLLVAAKAMSCVMKHLKPFFDSGEVKRNGVFVIGTVTGDLHDIGKNLVCMVLEGAGWQIIDLGVDVPKEKFIEAAKTYKECVIGLSALLTTTMPAMDETVKAIKQSIPQTKIIVGGAPITEEFAKKIGADTYAADPQDAVTFLNNI